MNDIGANLSHLREIEKDMLDANNDNWRNLSNYELQAYDTGLANDRKLLKAKMEVNNG